MLMNPLAAPRVEGAGLRHVSVGEPFDLTEIDDLERYGHPLHGARWIFEDLYRPHLLAAYRAAETDRDRSRPELLISHAMCFGASWVAHDHAIPEVAVTLSPCMWLSSQLPPIFHSSWVPPHWLHSRMMWAPRKVVRNMFSGSMPEICRELGQPLRSDPYFDHLARARINLGLWDREFRDSAADDPRHAHICGFPDSRPQWTQRSPLAPDVEAFLAAGDPPVIVALGSSVRLIGANIYASAVHACRELGRRCLVVGSKEQVAEAGPDLLHLDFAPYPDLLPRADIVVHAGGIGTTYEAMLSGRPSVIVPFANDQFDNAERARRLGVARIANRSKLDAPRMRGIIAELDRDGDCRRRAEALAQRLLDRPSGLEVAAQAIETEFAASSAGRNCAA